MQIRARTSASDITTEYPDDTAGQIRQLQIIKRAYASLTPSEPQLPLTNSALPALLALRAAQRLITDSADQIRKTHSLLQSARSRLSKEQSDLQDASLLTKALETRIDLLRNTRSSKFQESPDDAARALIETEGTRKGTYDRDTKLTMRALVRFINSTLAPMLAAEELGGPVVGDTLDVTEEMLAAGFNNQGKPKRSKAPINEDKRQRRIDDIWGLQGEDGQFEENPRNESQAAGEEMKALVEELLNAESEDGTGPWIRLERESAASRFLVRSGVALLHRTDAKRIRLVDYAREVDD